MADAITPEPGSSLFSAGALDLLARAIGGTQDQNISKTGNTTGTQSQTGTTAGTASNTQDSTTQSTADVEALKKVFAQQQAGITPELLAAIFSEGQKAAPQLAMSTANAVGARAGNNTPLATALTALNASLTSKAAELDLSQKNASAETAAKIAQLTGGTKTTGTTQQTSNQATNSTANSTTGSSEKTNNQTDTQPNYGNVTNLLGLLLGGSALNKGLVDFGGISGAVGAGTNAVGGLLQQLLKGFSTGGTPGELNPGTFTTPSSNSIVDALTNAGQQVQPGLFGNIGGAVTPPAGSANSLVPADFLGGNSGGGFDLSSLLSGLGLGGQSSESDFWNAIGLDPSTLSFGSATVDAGTTDLSNQDWFTGEGWNSLDWGG